MATSLKGESGHKSFAPLSQNQTLQICQHLQTLVTNLDGKVDDLRGHLASTDAKVERLRIDLAQTDSTVSSLKEKCTEMNNSMELVQHDCRQLNAGVEYAHTGLHQANEEIKFLRDGLKLANTNAKSFKEDMEGFKEGLQKCKEALANDCSSDLGKLVREHNMTRKAVENVAQDLALTNSGLQQERQSLIKTCLELDETKNFVTRTDKAVLSLEERLQEARKDTKSTRMTLQQTHAVVTKIHEDHENTKAQVKNSQKELFDHSVNFSKHDEQLTKTAQGLESIRGEHSETVAKLAASSQVMEQTANHVKSLREGFQMHSASIADHQRGLEHVAAMTHMTKIHIQESHSLLLPNLQMDAENPAASGAAQQFSMSSMGASSAGAEMRSVSQMSDTTTPPPRTAKRSARKPKVNMTNAWLLRNIGTSPDRMAMI
jgi:chromosome segregation ATPase